MLDNLESSDLELFEKIKKNPKPDIHDLWSLSPKRFAEWRRLNDFPKLLAHFDKTLQLFKEWKIENNLTNEIIISALEITPFLEHKRQGKDNKVYLIKQSYQGSENLYVDYGKIDGEREYLGEKYHYETILEFTSYLDWLKSKGKTQAILYINSRSGPNSPYERVFIHADVYATKTEFELLKMGGIQIPVNGFGHLFRGKKLEFVNLCGLKLQGNIYFGEFGNLSCSFCACDNWEAKNFSMAMLDFDHCSVNNFSLTDSELQQWSFYNSFVSGDFTNSKLMTVKVFAGNFSPILQDCKLFNVDINSSFGITDFNLYGYKLLKKVYADQGDEQKAKEYFIRENEYVRQRLKGINFFTKSLSYYYWEYGRKPHRIIYLSLGIIFVFSFLYWLNTDLIALNSSKVGNFTFWDSIYFSTTTFTTLGYGDLSPLGRLRILTSIEAFSGVVNMGFLIAGYSNNKY